MGELGEKEGVVFLKGVDTPMHVKGLLLGMNCTSV